MKFLTNITILSILNTLFITSSYYTSVIVMTGLIMLLGRKSDGVSLDIIINIFAMFFGAAILTLALLTGFYFLLRKFLYKLPISNEYKQKYTVCFLISLIPAMIVTLLYYNVF